MYTVSFCDEQVLALDQLHAHLLREERVLEIRRVERAGRHHGNRRAVLAGRRHGVQVLEQRIGIVLDRPDRLRREKLREEPHHHLAVLEHVRDAGGHAQIVLEHAVVAAVETDHVDAGDVRVDAAGDVDADHLAAVLRIAEHAFGGNDAGAENRLLVIDVVQEQVQRVHALLSPASSRCHSSRGNDARHEIERDQPLGARLLAVHGERDADAMKKALGLLALLRDAIRWRALEPVGERAVMRAHARRPPARISS